VQLVAPAENIFQHDDRAVHHHADPESQPPQRHEVQGKAAEEDQGEGGDQGYGDRQRNDQGAAQVAQKKEQHKHRQQAAVHDGLRDIGDGAFDKISLVEHRHDAHLGKSRVCRRDFGQHRLGHLDRVGLGLFADGHPQAALAIDPDDAGQFLVGVLDVGDLAQGGHRAVAVEDDHVADLIQILKFSRRPQGDLVAALLDAAGRQVEIGIADGLDHAVERQAQGLDPVGVEFNADLAVESAPQVYLGHARHARKPVADLVFDQFGELERRQYARNAQQHHREAGNVELTDARTHDIVGQFVNFVFDFGLHVQSGRIDGGPPDKTDPNGTVAFGRLRGDLLDARHRGHDLFDNAGDQPLHDLGTGAFILGIDGQGRQFNAGQHIDLQATERHGPQDHHNQGDHGGEYRSTNTETRQIHWAATSSGVEEIRLSWSGIVICDPLSNNC